MLQQHPRLRLAFALLSFTDFAMTWWLLTRPGGNAYEANPLAGWMLARAGWLGLAGYKLAAVAAVLGLTLLIARRRPVAAGRVLGLGVGSLMLVVGYSAVLGAVTRPAGDEERIARHLDEVNESVRVQSDAARGFRASLAEIEMAVRSGRWALAEGTRRLGDALARHGQQERWERTLGALYADSPEEQRMACWVVTRVGTSLRGDGDAGRVGARLEAEFRSLYGVALPARMRDWPPAPAPKAGLRAAVVCVP